MVVKLKVLKGSSAGLELPVKVSPFVIGRSDECNLKPKTDLISRRHCEIVIEAGKVLVRDLGSRNGTYVNGTRLEAAHELVSGDLLKVGPLEFSAIVESPAPQAKKPAAKQAGDSGVIGEWLQEADEIDRVQRRVEPETRQFRLEPEKTTASGTPTEASPVATNNTTIIDAEALKEAEQDKTKDKKKEPGKLPPRPSVETKNSRDAANIALKKLFFNK